MACLFAFALALRLFRLPDIPPGLNYDEAGNGLDALEVLAGNFSIFFERSIGKEPLFIYLQALSIWLLGPTPFALRAASALVGALTVPALYWMVREVFWDATRHPRRLAFLSAALLTVSYWHLNFSRIGYRAIMLPLFACVAMALFWRAWRRVRQGGDMPWTTLVVCGIVVGGSLYTYLAARFLPVLVALTVAAGILLRLPDSRQRRRATVALLVVAGAAIVVFAPLGAYFLEHPAAFGGRAEQVSVLNSGDNGLGFGETLGTAVWKTAAMFAVAGDENLRHNPAGRPLLDPLSAALFAVGLVICLWRWRSLPHLFLLAWLVVFSAPAVLSAESVPHFLRSLGMAPGVFVVSAVALMAAVERLAGSLPRLATLLPLPFLLVASLSSVGDYFSAWQGGPEPAHAFQAQFGDWREVRKAA